MENFTCNQYGERIAMLNTENVKTCERITKLEATKDAICLRFLPHFREFEFLVSQGSVATCLRWGGYHRMRFVANFIRFLQQCKNFGNQ